MLRGFFRKPLRLELPDRVVGFDSPGDFEFSLASRIEVPAGKIADLMRLAPDALRREASSIREVERRFVDVLAKSLEESGSIGYLMRDMDPKLFSQDHQWRVIMSALVKQGREFDEFKKIALVKYMQYLGSRQDVLRSIYASKDRPEVPEPDAESAIEAAQKETVIFDVTHISLASEPGSDLFDDDVGADAPADPPARARVERLPRGETVVVTLRDGEDVHLILSRHPFTIAAGQQPRLVDDSGTAYRLAPGRNVVGRQPECDVVIDAAYRDVSRKHLVIDLGPDGTARLTDLSSHGTFLDAGTAGHPTGP